MNNRYIGLSLNNIAVAARQVMGVEHVQICRASRRTNKLMTVATSSAADSDRQDVLSRPIDDPSLTQLWQNHRPGNAVKVHVGRVDQRYVVFLPMEVEGSIWGVLACFQRPPFSDGQRERSRPIVSLVEQVLAQRVRRLGCAQRLGRARRIEGKIVEAEERFRRDVAEELHGRVQTKLLMVSHTLEWCRQNVSEADAVRVRLSEVIRDVESIREEDVRKLSHRLHPGLIRVALRPAVHHLVATYSAVMTVDVEESEEFCHADSPMDSLIPADARITTYRVIEEALSNAVRHGQARHASVRLNIRRNALVVDVWDDGCGFVAEPGSSGIGLELLDIRLASAGGKLRVGSTSQGTLISAEIPLKGRLRYTSPSASQA